MNIQVELEKAVARIEARLKETKTPCKLYTSAARASSASDSVVYRAHFDFDANSITRYYVYIPSVNKYAVVFNLTSLLRKHGGDAAYFARRGFYSI